MAQLKSGTSITVGIVLRLPWSENLKPQTAYRCWMVTGIYMGGERQENVVGLKPLDQQPPTNVPEMMVPIDILLAAGCILD